MVFQDVGAAIDFIRGRPIGQVFADFQIADVLTPPIEPAANRALSAAGMPVLVGR